MADDFAALEASDPDDRRHHRPRGRAPEHDDPADRLGELHLARGARGPGVGAHQQVLRGLPGQALLRRQPRRRRGRGARPRSGPARCSAPTTPTCSRTPAPTPTWPPTWRCSRPATSSWACASTRAATSPTARRSTSAAGSTTSSPTASTTRPRRSTTTRSATSRRRSGRRRSSPAPPPTRASSTSRPSARSPTRSARCCIVDAAHIAGLIAGGAHPSPVPHADVVTFTTHKTLRGPRAGAILCRQEHAAAIDKAVFPGLQGGPLMHVIAAKAVAFHLAAQPDVPGVRGADRAQRDRAGRRRSPSEGFRIVSGGTDNHLMLVDLRPFGVTGKVAQEALDRAGITCNKNAIPNDPEKPFVTSGLRLGTAAVTTAGMGEAEMGGDRGADRVGAAGPGRRRRRAGTRSTRPTGSAPSTRRTPSSKPR